LETHAQKSFHEQNRFVKWSMMEQATPHPQSEEAAFVGDKDVAQLRAASKVGNAAPRLQALPLTVSSASFFMMTYITALGTTSFTGFLVTWCKKVTRAQSSKHKGFFTAECFLRASHKALVFGKYRALRTTPKIPSAYDSTRAGDSRPFH
jgi:hypothetical protein